MTLRVMSWNTLDAFSDAARHQMVLDEVYRQKPDVAFFSEAYREGQTTLLSGAKKDLMGSGYEVVDGLYHDEDGRKDRHGFMALYHESLGFVDAGIIRMAGRNAVEMRIGNDHGQRRTTLLGAHLDDRREHIRRAQAQSLVSRLFDSRSPQVVAGDLNTMHRTDRIARQLRFAGVLAPLVPALDPGETVSNKIYQKIGRAGSIFNRLAQMADGGTLAVLETAGLHDVDTAHQPTMPSKNPRFQLDHIMASHHFSEASDFEVLSDSPASDHRGIIATLKLR